MRSIAAMPQLRRVSTGPPDPSPPAFSLSSPWSPVTSPIIAGAILSRVCPLPSAPVLSSSCRCAASGLTLGCCCAELVPAVAASQHASPPGLSSALPTPDSPLFSRSPSQQNDRGSTYVLLRPLATFRRPEWVGYRSAAPALRLFWRSAASPLLLRWRSCQSGLGAMSSRILSSSSKSL